MKIFSRLRRRVRFQAVGILLGVVLLVVYLHEKGLLNREALRLPVDVQPRYLLPLARLFGGSSQQENGTADLQPSSTLYSRRSSPKLPEKKRVNASLRLPSAFYTRIHCNESQKLGFMGLDSRSVDLSHDPVCGWLQRTEWNPEKTFVAFGGEMAVLRSVTLDPAKLQGSRGGEEITHVLRQAEENEYFTLNPGAFTLPCKTRPMVNFVVGIGNYRRFNHMNSWQENIVCRDDIAPANSIGSRDGVGNRGSGDSQQNVGGQGGSSNIQQSVGNPDSHLKVNQPGIGVRDVNGSGPFTGLIPGQAGAMAYAGEFVPGVTFAVARYEYANVHHSLTDMFNTFLAMLILGVDPAQSTVLLIDGHPKGLMDEPWITLFGGRGVLRAGLLSSRLTFEYMVWIAVGYHSPLFLVELPTVSYLPELREFVFKRYGIQAKPGPVCPTLTVLFVLRRDYLAHPRNPSAQIQRKIANEAEISQTLRGAGYVVRDVQLDVLPIKKQLEVVAEADIMLGMHGAGLTWSLMLHEKAGLVEIAPFYFQKHSQCFKAISRWRSLHHIHWTNLNATNERPEYHTYLPPDIVLGMVNEIKEKICGQKPSAQNPNQPK